MLADGRNYPRSVIPILPAPSWRDVLGGGGAKSAFLHDTASYAQGRYALAEALRRAGVVAGGAVWLPAFHCRSMAETVLSLGAVPRFYNVTSDLCPDFAALSERVEDTPATALLLTHYFGFPNALDAAQQFCSEHKLVLIEDCAHAFYDLSGVLGTVGRYAIASPWKFLAVRDGGLLRDNTQAASSACRAQPWLANAKAWAAILQLGWQRIRSRRTLPVIDVDELRAQAAVVAAQSGVPTMGYTEFFPAQAALCALHSSRWLTAHAPHGEVAQRRRHNYQRWLTGVQGVPAVQALFLQLPDAVVPYAFPLLVDDRLFHLLKLAGMPVLRWEDMAVTDCAVANSYRVRLLQLPCHQSLREAELAWMIHAVQALALAVERL